MFKYLSSLLLIPAFLPAQQPPQPPQPGQPPQQGGQPGPGQQRPFSMQPRRQQASDFPWWESPIARDLNLTEDQQKQIQAALRESRNHMIDLQASVQKAEADFQDLFNEDQVDQKKTTDAIDRLVRARSDMSRAYSLLSLKLRVVLTPQQWHQLQQRLPQGREGQGGPPQNRQRGMGMRNGGGPGPGMGPRGPGGPQGPPNGPPQPNRGPNPPQPGNAPQPPND